MRNEVSKANQAIIDIRKGRENLNFIKKQINDNDQLINLINEFDQKITKVENNIHMTKNKSRQDPLNYGIRINNRIAFLLADSQRGDYPPTDQSKEFFIQVKGELDSEIMKLNALIDQHSQKIENYLEKNKIELISLNN